MTYQTTNPYNNEILKTFPALSDDQVEDALKRSHSLYKSEWSRFGQLDTRLKTLKKLGDLIEQRAEDIARTISLEMGKLVAQARDEVRTCAGIARYYAEHGARFLEPVEYHTDMGRKAWVEHHPIGLIMAVEPWNFPIYQLIRVAAPAMVVGNPVLVKHASIVPQCALLFEGLLRDAGAPEGAYTNLFASGDQVAKIIADPRVQGVALTGSEKTGAIIAAQAGQFLKKATMELGGNDVFVVLEDADVNEAAQTAAGARLYNAGQVCTSAKRYLVHERIYDDFLHRVIEQFKAVKPGDPLDEKTTLAPLSSAKAREDLKKQVEGALEKGAHQAYRADPIEGPGNFFPPTVLTDITRDNPAYFQEFFGPVAQVYRVADDDQIITLANDSHYGLGGTIFATDIERAKRLASRIETGMVFINRAMDSSAELPFGGVKRSGFGRELADLGVREFMNHKLVLVK